MKLPAKSLSRLWLGWYQDGSLALDTIKELAQGDDVNLITQFEAKQLVQYLEKDNDNH